MPEMTGVKTPFPKASVSPANRPKAGKRVTCCVTSGEGTAEGGRARFRCITQPYQDKPDR